METAELLNKVRKIEIKTRGLSNNIFAGEYHTAFKGKGMTFSEVREYQYGDEVRTIDWNVTARFKKPFVKVFEEEREMTVMLLIDLSSSSLFGSSSAYKRDVITEIAATIAFSAIQNNDKIGAIFFTDKIEKFIPPQKGRKHILFIIRELLEFKPDSNATDISLALRYLTNVIKKRCTSFVLSDFIDNNIQQDAFTIANRKHDVVAIQVYDVRDSEMPAVGLVNFKDAESGQRMWVDTNSSKIREIYRKNWIDSMTKLNQMVKYAGIDFVSLEVTEDYVKALMRLFNMRK